MLRNSSEYFNFDNFSCGFIIFFHNKYTVAFEPCEDGSLRLTVVATYDNYTYYVAFFLNYSFSD